MAQVDITINGRNYKVACDDGQEAHLGELGSDVDGRVKELSDAMGQVGDSRLLVMACLLIADELADAQRRVEEAEQAMAAQSVSPSPSLESPFDEDALAQGIESMAERIEGIADRLEQA